MDAMWLGQEPHGGLSYQGIGGMDAEVERIVLWSLYPSAGAQPTHFRWASSLPPLESKGTHNNLLTLFPNTRLQDWDLPVMTEKSGQDSECFISLNFFNVKDCLHLASLAFMLFLVLKHLSFYEIVLEWMDLLNGLTWQNKKLVIQYPVWDHCLQI